MRIMRKNNLLFIDSWMIKMASVRISCKWYAAIVNGNQYIHYGNWNDFKSLVIGQPGAKYKSFENQGTALVWLTQNNQSITSRVRPNIIPPIVSSSFSSIIPTAGPTVGPSISHGVAPSIVPSSFLSAKEDQYQVFTDGSHLKGKNKAGWAYVLIQQNSMLETIELSRRNGSLYDDDRTNNRAELMAILMTLRDIQYPEYTIFTDSQYSIKCVTVWHHAWQRNGWRTSKGTPVKNADLIRPIIEQLQARSRIELKYIAAHSGHKYNEIADMLAKEAAMNS
jgi:ribonuclease HI